VWKINAKNKDRFCVLDFNRFTCHGIVALAQCAPPVLMSSFVLTTSRDDRKIYANLEDVHSSPSFFVQWRPE